MNETCDAQAIADRVYNAFQCDNLWCEGDLVGDVQDLADEYDRLKNENQQLRKLVRILHDCDMKYNCDECMKITGGSGCDRLIRELEVEV